MIAVQDPWGQVLIPYAINLSERVFDVLNGLGLVFIPFIALFIMAFLEARAQGLDEGSPAVLAVKCVENGFWSMFILMVIFVIPFGNSESDVKFTKFQCGINGGNTALEPLYNLEPKLQQVGLELSNNRARLPLAIGLVNNSTVGVSESLSSQLPCGRSTSAIQAEVDKSFININNEALIDNLKQFSQACYSVGQQRIADGINNGTTKIADPYSKSGNFFFGNNLRMAYEGSANHPSQRPLTISIKSPEYVGPIKNQYKPNNYDPESTNSTFNYLTNLVGLENTTNKLIINCYDAAKDFKDVMELEFTKNQEHADAIERIFLSKSMFPIMSDDGAKHFITKNEVKEAYLHQAYIDAVVGKRSIIQEKNPVESNFLSESWNMLLDGVTSFMTEGETKTYMKERLVNLGMGVAIFEKATERTNLYAIIPMFITVITTVVYIATPFLFLLAGFSWKMAGNIIFVHFYLAMSYYMLNVAYLISDVLWMISDSAYGVSLKNSGLALHYMAMSSPVVVLVSWTAVCVLAGLNLGPFIVGLFTVNGVAAARAGTQMTKQATRGMSGGGGSSKRQVGG
ncbi:conjugal transfer protein TraG N-terminal domain-containing protein [Vibrio sp. 1180_3]|uniref:conjugal transfer protein TraG N-terminal domain-containing protein n=1 Tax=Vibrio sp. 1180_3 TaxID=2528832 RepID=UPI0024068209|nr:conjugal transfer protein TraG N-terminal domain-containing protein [Vibrio sp. 1180_3]MDF9399159.1 hypothetical protein [Vibrio sp. 1180_3]